jgi:hypothetical protein
MNNCYSYDMLTNRAYQERFAYIPSHQINRLTYICSDFYESNTEGKDGKALIVRRTGKTGYVDGKTSNYETILAAKAQSDYCRLVLDLPFLDKKTALRIAFTTEGLMKHVHKRQVGLNITNVAN